MAPKPRLFLIDGSSQTYRAYHAIRGLTGPGGRSTNAVYGFVMMLRKLIADHEPEYIAAGFDLAGRTFRSDLASDYKANRAPMPPDLAEQMPLVHEACDALGVPLVTHERYEADDVIGTIARRAVEAGFEAVIVTGDKDFFQLVEDGAVRVYNPRDEGTWFDAAGVLEKFGVPPARVVDVLALMGDSIDNIKGVPGIGEKGARDLIATHGSLDALIGNAATVPQRKYREALLAHAESARQSRELARIRTDVPLDLEFERFRYAGACRPRCFELFTRLGFRTLTTEFAPTADTSGASYRTAMSDDEIGQLVAALRVEGRFAMHVLTDGAVPMRARIAGLAFSTSPGIATYVPLTPPPVPASVEETAPPPAAATLFDDAETPPATAGRRSAARVVGPRRVGAVRVGAEPSPTLARLAPLLEDGSIAKVAHDLKTALVLFARRGVALAGLGDDTMLASYVLDATRSGHTIETLALEHAGYKAMSLDEACGRGAKAVGVDALPVDTQQAIAGERADLVGQLAARLLPDVEANGLGPVYRDLELPLVPVLAAIEQAGIRVDGPALAALATRVDAELAARGARIYDMAGMEFNINSPRQLSEVLFDRLQLPVTKKTGKTRTASTAFEVLEELALVHDIPREILEWRALAKLKGTYIDALPQLVDAATGRVHTSFNQAVAATGRLSSSDPNLQNIPIRTELGREIRRAFIADPGHVLISADYSQIELRVLAHLSGDESLTESFRRGEDIHDRTARAVFGTGSGLDPYELRRRAKIVNYALLYGKTAFTLARDIGVTQQAAQEFIDAYFAGFPGVRRFIDDTIARARETGVVKTMFGRRRLVPELTSRNGQVRAAAERVTVNMPIQGTAADILKCAMIDLHRRLEADPAGRRARMILTVHDELLFEAPENRADEIVAIVRAHMAAAADLTVPLVVDVGVGTNWKEAKP